MSSSPSSDEDANENEHKVFVLRAVWSATSNSENARHELLSDLAAIRGPNVESSSPVSCQHLKRWIALLCQRMGVTASSEFVEFMASDILREYGNKSTTSGSTMDDGSFDSSKQHLYSVDSDSLVRLLDNFAYRPRWRARHPKTVAILGGGAFGTSMAMLLGGKGNNVRILMRANAEEEHVEAINARHRNTFCFDGKYVLPDCVTATTSAERALDAVDFAVHATPVQFSRRCLRAWRAFIPRSAPIVSVSKGIESDSLSFMADIFEQEMPGHPFAVLAGPSYAAGIMQGDFTSVSLASAVPKLARTLQTLVTTPRFHAHTTDDVVSIEVASALKNVIAIGVGLVRGLGIGVNAQVALVTRSFAEVALLAKALGGRRTETLLGLAGLGDLMLTCFGGESRNQRFGTALATSRNVQEALDKAGGVVEGLPTAIAAQQLLRKHNVHAPVLSAIADALSDTLHPTDLITVLTTLPVGTEFPSLFSKL
jgi:glycerol-3-phosphate dehydrogenase